MSTSHVSSARVTIERYITSKDGNRPAGLERAFTQDAEVRIDSTTDGITFPPVVSGLAAISECMAGNFGRVHENVYTFCLSSPPEGLIGTFCCPWVVAMSMKDDRSVRVGWGKYDWSFDADESGLCNALHIHIAEMLILPAELGRTITAWVLDLPYPWIDAQQFAARVPIIDSLAPVNTWLANLGQLGYSG